MTSFTTVLVNLFAVIAFIVVVIVIVSAILVYIMKDDNGY